MTLLPREFATKESDYPLTGAIAHDWHREVAAKAFVRPSFGERIRGAKSILSGQAFQKALATGLNPTMVGPSVGVQLPTFQQGPTPGPFYQEIPSLTRRAGQAMDYLLWGDPKAFFPPGYPLQPQAPPAALGRKFDYPFYYNVNIQPRAYESISFNMLRDVSRNSWDVLRLVIETAKSQISAQPWSIVPSNDDITNIPSGTQDRIDELTKFFRKPDMRRSFSKWMRMLLEDLFVLDAPCFYVERCNDGSPYALRPIDGGTITPKLDYWGDIPQAPEVAFQQIIKGLPALDYTTEDMVYWPYNQTTNTAYGYSPVEQMLITINIAARRQFYQLEYYKSGANTPFLLTAPPEFTPNQLEMLNTWYNSMFVDNPAQRWRTVILPYGSKPVEHSQTSRIELKDDMDDYLTTVCCYAFSVDKSQLQKMMNRASAEHSGEQSEKEGFGPFSYHVQETLTDLVQDDAFWGYDDVKFVWGGSRQMMQLERAQCYQIYTGLGAFTINEIRADLGKDPLEGGDQCIISTNMQLVEIDETNKLSDKNEADQQAQETQQAMQEQQLKNLKNPPAPPAAGAAGSSNGAPKPSGPTKPSTGTQKPSGKGGTSGKQVNKPTPKPSSKGVKKGFDVSPGPTTGLQGYDLEGQEKAKQESLKMIAEGKSVEEIKQTLAEKASTMAIARGHKRLKSQKKKKIGRIITVQYRDPDEGKVGKLKSILQTALTERGKAVAAGLIAKRILPASKFSKTTFTSDYSQESASGETLRFIEKAAAADNSRFSARRPQDILVFVPIDQMEDRLQKHKDLVNPVDGDRYEKAKAFVQSGQLMHAPEVEIHPDGSAVIADGRHRYKSMYDLGYKDIPIALSPASAENAKATGLLATVQKAFTDTGDWTSAAQAKPLIDSLLKQGWSIYPAQIAPIFEDVAEDSAQQLLGSAGFPPTDEMWDHVDQDVADLALDRAGELVGMKYDSDTDQWFDNPDAQWTITEDVRDELAQLVSDAQAGDWSNRQLQLAIEQAKLFAQERAEMIARTELKRIDSMASDKVGRTAGATLKRWTLSEDPNVCDECKDNHDQGFIPIDEPFQDGSDYPPAHPKCRCTEALGWEDDPEENDDDGD